MGECLRRARGAGWPPSGHSPRWRAETQPLCHLHRSSGSLQNGWTEEEALPQVRVPTKRCLSVPRASHIQQRGHVPEAGLPCQSSEHCPGMPSGSRSLTTPELELAVLHKGRLPPVPELRWVESSETASLLARGGRQALGSRAMDGPRAPLSKPPT